MKQSCIKKILIITIITLSLLVTACSGKKKYLNNTIENNVVFEKGIIDDNVYINTSLNLKYVPTNDIIITGNSDDNGDGVEFIAVDTSNPTFIMFFCTEKVSSDTQTVEQYFRKRIDELPSEYNSSKKLINYSEMEDYKIGNLIFQMMKFDLEDVNLDNVQTNVELCTRVNDLFLVIDTFDICFDRLIKGFTKLD